MVGRNALTRARTGWGYRLPGMDRCDGIGSYVQWEARLGPVGVLVRSLGGGWGTRWRKMRCSIAKEERLAEGSLSKQQTHCEDVDEPMRFCRCSLSSTSRNLGGSLDMAVEGRSRIW